MADEPNNLTFAFKAEIQQLLHILTHSLYTHRDIFIRELISNATDALDKARFRSIKGEAMSDPNLDFEIRIETDKDKKLLIIRDSGIGMTREELIENIGTIARSGTAEFLKQMSADKENTLNLIGRFGVGFYSVFMAGEKVEIISKSAVPEQPAHLWCSDGQGEFTIEPIEHAERGTTIRIYLRDDAKEFLEKYQLENIIKKYSNFVPFPIYIENEQVNKISAIWREPRSSVTDQQYAEFYKFIFNETDDPLLRFHLSAEVPVQFHCLLFVPKINTEGLGIGRDEEGIHLFVRRVLVDAHAKEILPGHLRFLRGVLDSDDLPLNISRETLQDNPYLLKIKSTIVSKFLGFLQDTAKNDETAFIEFWRQHGRIFKEGYTDFLNKEKFIELLRFNSSKSADEKELISLQAYLDRMPEEQEEIYFLSGPTREAIRKNPNLEIFQAKDIEVLYCYDPVDEFALPSLAEFQGKKFVSADQVDMAKLQQVPGKETEEKPAAEAGDTAGNKEMENLARKIKEILGSKVEEVKVSSRLTDSPAVLSGGQAGLSAQMQRFMHQMDLKTPLPKKNMEINPKHPLILNLLQIYQKNVNDEFMAKIVSRLFDSILWLDGYLEDPHATAMGLQEILAESAKLYMQQK